MQFLADLCSSFVRKQPKKEQKSKLLDCCIPVRSHSSLACLSPACISLGMLLKAKFTPAVGSVQSLTPCPPPPLSLSLSLRVTRFEPEKRITSSKLDNIRTSKRNVATRSRSPGLQQLCHSVQWLIQKKKCRAFSCNAKLCFVNFERPQTRSRLGQLYTE